MRKSPDDHRHHAIDALVVALTTPKAVHHLSRYGQIISGRLKIKDIPMPIPNLRDQVYAVINGITVSHKPLCKLKGALHEETLYRLTQEKNEKGDEFVVLRKYIKDLKPKDLNDIRDPKIRKLAVEHFETHGQSMKAFQDPTTPFGFMTKKDEFRKIEKSESFDMAQMSRK